LTGPTIEFEIVTPSNDLVGQVTAALALGLPDVAWRPERADALTIVANGPTARQASLGGTTLALNGALKVFTDQGLAPTYWAACDPQALVADFLTDAPVSTTYLVASKCHPDVFRALAGHKVLVWHIDDFSTWELVKDLEPIMSAVSITICSFELMHRLGFRRFETWGWDGCFMDGKAHATDQPGSDVLKTVTLEGRAFETTGPWALEAQDAMNKLRLSPYDVTIHGDGLIGAVYAVRDRLEYA